MGKPPVIHFERWDFRNHPLLGTPILGTPHMVNPNDNPMVYSVFQKGIPPIHTYMVTFEFS